MRNRLIPPITSLALPGAGHVLVGSLSLGAIIAATFLGIMATAVLHLTSGLAAFDSTRGSFLFACALRAGSILYGFSAFDSYLRRVEPNAFAEKRRLALLCNLLLPGAGYIFARNWIRTATGLLITAMVVLFAGRPNRYIDLIYVCTQLIMGITVYHQMAVRDARLDHSREKANHTFGGQMASLFAVLVALTATAIVVQMRMPNLDYLRLRESDTDILPTDRGIQVSIAKLGLRFTAIGSGWILDTQRSGEAFHAQHADGGSLRVAARPLVPFSGITSYVERLRVDQMSAGYIFDSVERKRLGPHTAWHMRLHRTYRGSPLRRETVILPSKNQATLFLFECSAHSCATLQPTFDKTLLSISLKN